MPTHLDILNDWSGDPERPIFLVDETRRPIFGKKDEIIFFTCVSLKGKTANAVFKNIQAVRTTNNSFKALDLNRPEVQRDFAPLVGNWCASLLLADNVNIVATTAKAEKKSKNTKARLRMIYKENDVQRPPIVEGRELNTVLHLILKAAIDQGIDSGSIDVIVDSSDQMGLSSAKRRLSPGTFEVMGPARLDRRPDGTQASLTCPALFRIIASSDRGSFRDLLMLPELFGYLSLYGETDFSKTYDTFSDNPFQVIPFSIGKFKKGLTAQVATKAKV